MYWCTSILSLCLYNIHQYPHVWYSTGRQECVLKLPFLQGKKSKVARHDVYVRVRFASYCNIYEKSGFLDFVTLNLDVGCDDQCTLCIYTTSGPFPFEALKRRVSPLPRWVSKVTGRELYSTFVMHVEIRLSEFVGK